MWAGELRVLRAGRLHAVQGFCVALEAWFLLRGLLTDGLAA